VSRQNAEVTFRAGQIDLLGLTENNSLPARRD
jgi:hypothetical protein